MYSKRSYILIAALVLLSLAVTACAGQSQQQAAGQAEEQTIRLWVTSQWNGVTGVESGGQPLDWWNDRIGQWQAGHPGVNFEIEDLGQQDVEINAKYDTAIAAGNIADIIWLDESFFTKYASADVLAPIDDFMTAGDRQDFLAKDLELSRLDGQQWFWPYITQANHMAINVSLFKEVGAEDLLPQGPDFTWTWDQFVEAANALTIDRDGDGTTDVFGVGFSTDGAYTMAEGWGDHLYKQGDESKVTINTQNTIDAFNALRGLVDDELALPGSGTGSIDLDTNFLQQRVAMINTWGIVTSVETLPENEKFELILAPFPHGPNGQPTVWGGVHGLGVTKQDDPARLELVMDLANFLTSTDALQDVRAWSKPARASLLDAQRSAPDFLYEQYIPQFQAYADVLIPLMGQGPNAVPVLVKYEPLVEAVFTGDLTPEEALSQFEEEANVILSE